MSAAENTSRSLQIQLDAARSQNEGMKTLNHGLQELLKKTIASPTNSEQLLDSGEQLDKSALEIGQLAVNTSPENENAENLSNSVSEPDNSNVLLCS